MNNPFCTSTTSHRNYISKMFMCHSIYSMLPYPGKPRYEATKIRHLDQDPSSHDNWYIDLQGEMSHSNGGVWKQSQAKTNHNIIFECKAIPARPPSFVGLKDISTCSSNSIISSIQTPSVNFISTTWRPASTSACSTDHLASTSTWSSTRDPCPSQRPRSGLQSGHSAWPVEQRRPCCAGAACGQWHQWPS